ncbi:TPA: hypothetical protein ACPZOD_004310 [Yersinia enterocolitica]
MTDDKFYEYLVLGGEYHGQVFSYSLTSTLQVPLDVRSMAKFYAPTEPAEVNQIQTIPHRVIEHITPDGRHFFIASNEDITNLDVEQEIRIAEIRPIN